MSLSPWRIKIGARRSLAFVTGETARATVLLRELEACNVSADAAVVVVVVVLLLLSALAVAAVV